MAQYLIRESCYVNNRYVVAAPNAPAKVEFPDNTEPSRKWEPLDKPAQKALEKLTGKKVPIADLTKVHAPIRDAAEPEKKLERVRDEDEDEGTGGDERGNVI